MKALIIIFLLSLIVEASAKNYRISPDNGSAAIQRAVDSSSVSDTLFLEGGVYYLGAISEWGLAAKPGITLIGASAETCILSALDSLNGKGAARHIITIIGKGREEEVFNLINVSLQGARASGEYPFGGGIFCYNANLSAENCNFRDNTADSLGGGVAAFDSKLEFYNCVFSENESVNGGAVFVDGSLLNASNTSFSYNSGYNGGAIFASSTDLNLNYCAFSKNISDTIGGAVFLYNADKGGINNCEFIGNRSINGGAISYYDSDLNLSASKFLDNYARGGGALFLVRNSAPHIFSCKLERNSAYEGGAVFLDSCGRNGLIEKCEFISNSAIGYAGAFFFSNSINSLEGCLFQKNKSQDGAGIFTFNSRLTTKSNSFIDNTSIGYGGALYIYGESKVDMLNDLLYDNRCAYGAGLYFEYQSVFNASKCSFIGNIARLGGAFCTVEMSKPTFSQCLFVDNGSYEGYTSGLGSIVVNSDTVSIVRSNCYNNTLQDKEDLVNDTKIDINLNDNYWGVNSPDEAKAMIVGKNKCERISDSLVDGAPGEPLAVSGFEFFSKNGSKINSFINSPDTIKIKAYASDRNPDLTDALCLKVKSSVYPDGISLALPETEASSGAFEGRLILKNSEIHNEIFEDDAKQVLRINPDGDEIIISPYFFKDIEEKIIYSPANAASEVCHENEFFKIEGSKVFFKNICDNNKAFIYNYAGKLAECLEPIGSVDLSYLPAGVYFIIFKDTVKKFRI